MKPVVYTFVKSLWIGDRELIMYMVLDSYNDYSFVFADDYEECDEFMDRQREEFSETNKSKIKENKKHERR